MKRLFITVIAVIATVSASAQVETKSTPVTDVANDGSTVKKVIVAGNEFSEISFPFMEKFAGQRTDQIFMTTADGRTWWSGETIEGWHMGIVAGGTTDGWIGGVQAGYSGRKFDVDVTVRAGQVNFMDQKYTAPSAFVEFKPTLFKWGKYESNKLYAGGRVGYQYAKSYSVIDEKGDNYEFYREAKLSGSGFAYGAVLGWEKRSFMSGHRFGAQIAAYTYDVEWSSNTNKTVSQGWVIEASIVWKFVFHKKAKNF